MDWLWKKPFEIPSNEKNNRLKTKNMNIEQKVKDKWLTSWKAQMPQNNFSVPHTRNNIIPNVTNYSQELCFYIISTAVITMFLFILLSFINSGIKHTHFFFKVSMSSVLNRHLFDSISLFSINGLGQQDVIYILSWPKANHLTKEWHSIYFCYGENVIFSFVSLYIC